MPALSLPAFRVPRVAGPRFSLPRLRLPQIPRIPRIAWVVGLVLAILLIAPLAYVLLPSGRQLAARATPLARPPGTTAGQANVNTPRGAAIPGVEAKTGLRYSSGPCASNKACLTLASETAGAEAAAVVFTTAGSGGRQCAGYVYHASGTWHFLNAVCALPGQLAPLAGRDAVVHVPGNCARVRIGASLKANPVVCVNDGAVVHLDGGPAYADGLLWWHVANRGWIAHDFLVV
jgi:hypothetical protein